jgi:hypothetical protein
LLILSLGYGRKIAGQKKPTSHSAVGFCLKLGESGSTKRHGAVRYGYQQYQHLSFKLTHYGRNLARPTGKVKPGKRERAGEILPARAGRLFYGVA